MSILLVESEEMLFDGLPARKFFLEADDPELAYGMSLAHDPPRKMSRIIRAFSSMPRTFDLYARTTFPEFDGIPGIEASMGKQPKEVKN